MISEKQKKILAFPYSNYDAIICDGAVRSGKEDIFKITDAAERQKAIAANINLFRKDE